ncbi:AB-hydrolase YheT [Russula earlei]|uniref:AB-hydrolase YheT n=1 Tax=Russula earlei TaxID=71964 RepID=A0ACC0UCX3_9AGAM|nr:AB-hydrolase YheT [Russula earlei]
MGSALSVLGYQANPKTFFSSRPLNLRLLQPDTSETTSLRSLLELHCPSLSSDFRPAWCGHLQTLYAVVGDFSAVDPVVYDRRLLRIKDGGTLGLDFTPSASDRVLPDETPIVVVLHGLTGGSYESYVRAIIGPATKPIDQGGLGYRAVVVNFRGCAGVPLTTPQLYSSCHTDDLRQALLYISHRYPTAPLLGLGFSLGANILTRYVAEEGEDCRFISACALACPWDLTSNGEALHGNWFTRNVYAKGMGSNLKQHLSRHADTIMKYPDSRLAQCLPELLSRKSITLVQFDDLITVHAGGTSPPFPFKNAREYYTYAASHQVLGDVRIPFLAVNSDDDPVVKHIPIYETDNEWVTLVVTRGGGHMGWFESKGKEIRRWIRRPVLEWLRATAEKIDVPRRVARSIEVVDGWLVESGREHLGCKDHGEGGRIVGGMSMGGVLPGL